MHLMHSSSTLRQHWLGVAQHPFASQDKPGK